MTAIIPVPKSPGNKTKYYARDSRKDNGIELYSNANAYDPFSDPAKVAISGSCQLGYDKTTSRG
ncbi:Protein pyrABCN [Sphaceloma murrayae]|uniref:Protein pyrABCN n=1 Tax=Sphaceloma murrayae TaxID=2082308 RepID=A0A2K1QP48_9PEZI|nr:Protein pyrABCN [Sphaceloma murrayae]